MIHIVTSDGSCPSLDGQSFNKHWWVFGFNDGCDSDSADLIVSAVGVCSAASRTHRFGGRTGSNQGARSKVNRASRTQHDSTIFATCTRLIISCIWYVVICSQIQFFSAVFIHFPEILSERSRQQRRHLQKSKKNSKHAESTAENLGSQFLHTYMLNLSASCSKCRFFGLCAWLGELCLKTLFVPFPFILRFSFWTRLCPACIPACHSAGCWNVNMAVCNMKQLNFGLKQASSYSVTLRARFLTHVLRGTWLSWHCLFVVWCCVFKWQGSWKRSWKYR